MTMGMGRVFSTGLLLVLLAACNGGSDDGDDTSNTTSDTSAAAADRSDDAAATEPAAGDELVDNDGDTAEPLTDVAEHIGALISQALPQARKVTTARVTGDARAQATLTFGQVFAEDDLADGENVWVTDADGRILASQTDIKAHWPDGSVRHAVLTVAVPGGKAVSAIRVYAARAGRAEAAPVLSASRLLSSSDWQAQARFTIDGRVYTADARQALAGHAKGQGCAAWGEIDCKRWLAGPLASEWIVTAPLVDKSGDPAPRLRVAFHIRGTGDTTGHVDNIRVDTVIENTNAYADNPSNMHYDARLSVGQSQYQVADLSHYRNARWHHVLWTEGAPKRRILASTAYLQASRAISNYPDLAPGEDFLDGLAQSYPPMAHGDQTPDMIATGAQAGIGPLPRWTSSYVTTGDERAFGWMMANDDAAGSYGFHYRDAATGRPLSIVDHPYVTLANYAWARVAGGAYTKDLLPPCNSDCQSPWHYDIAHQPSVGYVAYLTTGDFYYLEEMQFVASYDELWANESYREHDKGRLLVSFQQVRSQAWTLRAISDAAFATPDDDPMKSYFVDQIDYIVGDYLDNYVDDTGHPLHVLDDFGAIHYPGNRPPDHAIAPWQQDFFTWAVGHAAEQGVPGAQRLLDWFAPWYAGLMTNVATLDGNDFCWLQASGYTLQLRDDTDSPRYTSLDTVYRKSFPALAGLACNSEAMRVEMSDNDTPTPVNEMVGYPRSPTGFPANLQVGLAMIADTGQNGVAQAWQVFAGRASQPDYAQEPQFDVVPRTQ